jgi:hypothetical protein
MKSWEMLMRRTLTVIMMMILRCDFNLMCVLIF